MELEIGSKWVVYNIKMHGLLTNHNKIQQVWVLAKKIKIHGTGCYH